MDTNKIINATSQYAHPLDVLAGKFILAGRGLMTAQELRELGFTPREIEQYKRARLEGMDFSDD